MSDEQDFTYVHQFERRDGFTWRFVGQVLTDSCLGDMVLDEWLKDTEGAKPGPYRILSYSRAFPLSPSLTEVVVGQRVVWDVSRAEVPNPFESIAEPAEVPA